MSDNLSNKTWNLLADELLQTEGADIGDLLDYSSGSSDIYLSEEEYESDDSLFEAPARKVPRLSKPGPSTALKPIASSSPLRLHTDHPDLSNEDDSEVPVLSNAVPNSAAPWVRVYDSEPEIDVSPEFTVRNPGSHECPVEHSPINYFSLFFTEGLLLLLVRETNIYAHKQIEKLRGENKLTPRARLSSWVNVTLDEMKKFITILFLMGLTRRKLQTDYWSNDELLHYPIIKTLMPMRRFEALCSMLHMTSRPTLRRGTPGYDPWVKIRPFLDAVNDSFVRHYTPFQNLSLDESLVEMKNRCVYIQYMPNKRHARYGIKKFELVDAKTLYVVQLSLYSGTDFLQNKSGPFTQNVVLDLMGNGRCLGKGYHVFTDYFYTKLPLARELLENKTFLTGTINKNLKDLPKSLVTSDFTVGEPVNYRQGKVLLVGFKEKHTRRPVFLMSTACEANSTPVVNSRGRESTKPIIIQRYNKFMGGVGCKDKSLFHVSCTRTTKKYWKKLFYNLLDTCIQNAYVLYALQSEGSVMTRDRFILSVARSLSGLEQPQQPPPSPSTSVNDNNAGHFITPAPNKSKKLCPVCFKYAYYWCPGCNCGVHQLCYYKLEHKFRPKYSVRKPKPTVNNDSD